MIKFKGSKGNWKEEFTVAKLRAVRDEGGLICVIPNVTRWEGQVERYKEESQEADANQKLIAAAPDMLKALQNLENDFEEIPPLAWKKVQDAITKAVGDGN